MGDDDYRAGILAQGLFEPLHRFRVEVVRRLVQEQQVRFFQKRHAQCHPPPLAAGKLSHGRFVGRQHQGVGGDVHHAVQLPAVAGVDLLLQPAHLFHEPVEVVVGLGVGHLHGDLVEAVDEVLDRLHGGAKVVADGLVEVQLRLLGDVADAHVPRQGGGAFDIGFDAGHDFQQGRFSGPVLAHDADLGAVEEGEVDVIENDALAVAFADVVHFKDELGRHSRVFIAEKAGEGNALRSVRVLRGNRVWQCAWRRGRGALCWGYENPTAQTPLVSIQLPQASGIRHALGHSVQLAGREAGRGEARRGSGGGDCGGGRGSRVG